MPQGSHVRSYEDLEKVAPQGEREPEEIRSGVCSCCFGGPRPGDGPWSQDRRRERDPVRGGRRSVQADEDEGGGCVPSEERLLRGRGESVGEQEDPLRQGQDAKSPLHDARGSDGGVRGRRGGGGAAVPEHPRRGAVQREPHERAAHGARRPRGSLRDLDEGGVRASGGSVRPGVGEGGLHDAEERADGGGHGPSDQLCGDPGGGASREEGGGLSQEGQRAEEQGRDGQPEPLRRHRARRRAEGHGGEHQAQGREPAEEARGEGQVCREEGRLLREHDDVRSGQPVESYPMEVFVCWKTVFCSSLFLS